MSPPRPEPGERWRRVLSWVLVALTALAVVAATLAVWAHRTLFDTDRFMAVVGPVLEDPQVVDALAGWLGDQVVEAVGVEERVEATLGRIDSFLARELAELLDLGPRQRELLSRLDLPGLSGLAPGIAESVDARIRSEVEALVQSEEFRRHLSVAVAVGHGKAVAVLRGDGEAFPNVSVEGGAVTLNLVPIVAELIRSLAEGVLGFVGLDVEFAPLPDAEAAEASVRRLAGLLGADLPSDFGQIPIMSEDRLREVQQVAVVADRLVWGLVVLAVALAAATIVASPRRGRAVVRLGVGVVAGFVLAWLALGWLEATIGGLASDPENRAAIGVVLSRVFSGARTLGLVVAVGAGLAGLLAYLAVRGETGPPVSR